MIIIVKLGNKIDRNKKELRNNALKPEKIKKKLLNKNK